VTQLNVGMVFREAVPSRSVFGQCSARVVWWGSMFAQAGDLLRGYRQRSSGEVLGYVITGNRKVA
jgi:hypothetical protein